jgi:hypothetical protein
LTPLARRKRLELDGGSREADMRMAAEDTDCSCDGPQRDRTAALTVIAVASAARAITAPFASVKLARVPASLAITQRRDDDLITAIPAVLALCTAEITLPAGACLRLAFALRN